MKINQMPRRHFLRIGGAALAAIPVMVITGRADAATNVALRTALKYQNKPEGDKNCANCVQFIPGATSKDLGGCKVIAGDSEISPAGYCTVWIKKT